MPTTPGSFIPRFAFWNPSTWAIPELYWDTFSQEQRIHAICKQLGKVIAYADMLGVNTDDIAARLKAIEEGQLDDLIKAEIEQWFEDNEPAIIAALDALNDALPISAFDENNTVKDYVDDLAALLPDTEFTSASTVKDALDSIESLLPASSFSSLNTVKDYIDTAADSLNVSVGRFNVCKYGADNTGTEYCDAAIIDWYLLPQRNISF